MFKSQAQIQPDALPRVFETGIYPMVIDMAYLDQSAPREVDGKPAGQAYSLTVVLKAADGRTHKETLWITGGVDKGQLTYFVNKQGEKQDLPGFAVANSLSVLSTGKELGEYTPEDKMVAIYDYAAKKEIPTSKPVFMELIGQKINVAIQKVVDHKTAKNPTTGVYEPTSETREYNEIKHVFKEDTNQSLYEFTNGKDATYAETWAARNSGKTYDKAAKASGTTGTTTTTTASAPGGKPLFG